MEHLIKSTIRDIDVSVIRQFNMMANKINKVSGDVVFFTLGEPMFNTLEPIKNAAIKAICDNKTRYTATMGMLELREKISGYIDKHYNLNYNTDEILVTTGSTEAVSICMNSIIMPGDEVVIPCPAYPLYEIVTKMNHGVPVLIDTTGDDYQITAEKIEKAINEKTKMIVLCSPSNPTGVQISQANKRDILNLLKDKDIFLLVDEVYSNFVFDGEFSSFGAMDESLKEKILLVNGFSKSCSMTGWRLGYVCGDKKIIKHINKTHAYTTSTANSISQNAAIEALNMDINYKEMYLDKFNYVYERLTGMGFDCVKPNGTFYIFPSIKKFNMGSEKFCKELLEKKHVATVPGTAFSVYGEGTIRLSYDIPMLELAKGLDLIEEYVREITIK